MITFDCPNCGCHLKVGEEFAGREGWCRQCRNILTVPEASGMPARALDPEQKTVATERMFRHAAARAESYRVRAEEAESALASYAELKTQFDDLASRYLELESGVRQMEEKSAGYDAVKADLDAASESHLAELRLLDERINEVRDLEGARDSRLTRLENLVNELSDRLDKLEQTIDCVPKEIEVKPVEDIHLLKKDIAKEHAARLRIEGLLHETAGKIAELESNNRMPMVLPAEPPREEVNPIEDGADAVNEGKDEVLGAFLRFMEQTPRQDASGN